MKKRLRKKRHVGEFREYAFRLDIKLNVGYPSPEFEKFVDDFILDCIEGQGMSCSGSLGETCEQIIEAQDARTTNQQHIDAVKTWMEKCPAVESFTLGELKDAWYDDFGF